MEPNFEGKNQYKYALDVNEMDFLKNLPSEIKELEGGIKKKEGGGYILTNFNPHADDGRSASIHIDNKGNVTSGHNQEEVQRNLKRLKNLSESKDN